MKKEFFKNIVIGFFAGIISGFFGAGGGLILVPYMTINLKKDEVISRATTIFCIFFMVVTSSLFYLKNNSIDFVLSLKCIIGGIIGSYLGTRLLYMLNKNILKTLFAIFLVYCGIRMFLQSN